MRRMLLLGSAALFVLAMLLVAPRPAQAFVYDGGLLSTNKTTLDNHPELPSSQKYTGTEINTAHQAVNELSTLLKAGVYHGLATQTVAPPAPASGLLLFALDAGAGLPATLYVETADGAMKPVGASFWSDAGAGAITAAAALAIAPSYESNNDWLNPPYWSGAPSAPSGGIYLLTLDGGAGLQPTLNYETPDGTVHDIGTVCPIDLNFANIPNQDLTAAGTYTLGSSSGVVTRGSGAAAAVYVDAGSLVAINSASVVNTQMSSCATVIPAANWYMKIAITDPAYRGWYPSRLEIAGQCGTGSNASQIGVLLMNRDSSGNLGSVMGTGVFSEIPGTSIMTGQCGGSGGVGPEVRNSGLTSARAGMVMSLGNTGNFVASYYSATYSGTFDQNFWSTNATPNEVLNTTTSTTWSSSTRTTDLGGWGVYIVPSDSSFNAPAVCTLQRVRFCYTPTWSQ